MKNNDNFFSIDYAEKYMSKVKESYIELGENYILINGFHKHLKIKEFDDKYFINLIAKLEKQTYPSNEDISKYYTEEWIKIYYDILFKRRIKKINKIIDKIYVTKTTI
jgi:hypothetical protein